MRTNDLGVIGAAAAVTMAIMVVLSQTVPSAIAVEPKKKAIAPGTLTVNGVELTAQVDPESSKPGKKPVVKVTAVNTQDQPVEVHATIYMTSMSLASRFSRMPVRPESIWSDGCYISLKPNETRTYELPTNKAAGKGAIISFSMKAGGKTVAVPGAGILALLKSGGARQIARPAVRLDLREVARR